jgi:hypothetical protein
MRACSISDQETIIRQARCLHEVVLPNMKMSMLLLVYTFYNLSDFKYISGHSFALRIYV